MRTLKPIVVAILFLGGSACRTASAQVVQAVHASEHDFIPVYKRYADTIDQEGAAGFRKIATPDFVTFSADGNKQLSGSAAFDELTRRFTAVPMRMNSFSHRQYTVCFSVYRLSDREAVIYTEEIRYSLLPWNTIYVGPILNTEQFSANTTVTLMISQKCSARWKQTWRNTADGWRLASTDVDTRTDAERDTQDVFRYVVKSEVLDFPQFQLPPPTP